MSEKVYLNGKLIEANVASVSVSNPAFLHGVGLFETLRAYDGRPFRLPQHLERLQRSANALNIPLGNIVECIPQAITAVLEANSLKNARVRFTVTPTASQDEPTQSTLLVAAQEITGYPEAMYQEGMTVFICNQYRQSKYDPLAGHKTTSYFSRLLALRLAQQKQCGEAIWFTPENLLAEGSISNIFMVKDNKLRTPPLETPVLPGITRSAILELAQSNHITVDQGPCTINDLLGADEAFLTNAIMEIMPVTRVERHVVGNEKPGPITQQLADAYRNMTTATSST